MGLRRSALVWLRATGSSPEEAKYLDVGTLGFGSRLASVITVGLSPLAGLAAIMAGPPFMTTVGSVGLAFIIIDGLSPSPGFADIMAPPFMATEDYGDAAGAGCNLSNSFCSIEAALA